MRRTFGLTALLLLTLAVLAAAGCTGAADSGAGVLNPFPVPSTGGGATSSPSPSVTPTFSPLPVGTVNVLTSRNNPTRQVPDSCGNIFLVEGFNLGQANGRIVRYRFDTENNVSASDPASPQTLSLVDTNGNGVQLNNPVWVDAGVNPSNGQFFLVVTDGFGTAQGRILYIVPNLAGSCNYTGSAVVVADLGLLAVGAPVNPLGVDFDGRFIWWTEYLGAAQGRVRRVDLQNGVPTAPGSAVDYMVGLEFPAGIESNGSYVAIAQNGANNYILSQLDAGLQLPTSTADPQTIAITAATGDPVMLRPFEVSWLNGDTFVALDGFGFTVAGGPGSAGPGNGNVRYYTGPGPNQNPSNFVIDIVQSGLTDPVGLGVIYDAAADGTRLRADVAFVESVNSTGTVRRLGFSTTTPFTIASNQILINNFNRGFHAGTIPVRSTTAAPVVPPTNVTVFATQGLDLGIANGSVVRVVNPY